MNSEVVHVTTLEQWKSVLDVWFKQGCEWRGGRRGYQIYFFENHLGRHLKLGRNHEISYWSLDGCNESFIEYSEFLSQQKEDNKMATVYEVSQPVLDKLQMIKAHVGMSLIEAITCNAQFIKSIAVGNKAILRYLSDDPAIEFKVQEPLYRLWATDQYGAKVYFKRGRNIWSTTVTEFTNNVFEAPLEEIKKWKTPAWEIEKVEVQ